MSAQFGNINPTKLDFREYLERFHRNKLFLGIRYGNVWEGDSLVAALDNPQFIANMNEIDLSWLAIWFLQIIGLAKSVNSASL